MLGEFCFISLFVYTLSATVLEKEIITVKNPSSLRVMNATLKDLTHNGRENLILQDSVSGNTLNKSDELNISTSTSLQLVDIPPHYDSSGEINDGKPIVAKKGAVYNVSDLALASNKIPSTTKAVITHLNVEKNETLDSHIVSLKNDTEKLNLKPLQSPDSENEIQIGSRSNIVLPVIAVILSVPLVGILIAVFYKRGAEWWQHRHYRRMDFLIDGIYNN